jgi:hypothetical protein
MDLVISSRLPFMGRRLLSCGLGSHCKLRELELATLPDLMKTLRFSNKEW